MREARLNDPQIEFEDLKDWQREKQEETVSWSIEFN